jgi:hypothetical protein
MGFILVILGLLLFEGSSVYKSKNNDAETKKIEAVVDKTADVKPTIKDNKPKPVKEEIKAEPVKEEIKAEPVKEETKAEPVKEETKAEPVKEETKAEPVKEETKAEPVKEVVKDLDISKDTEKNYFRLVLYVIGGILVALSGLYFFSRKQNNSELNIQSETTEAQPTEEVQSETTEAQPTEEVQSETTEAQPTEEDENNNK